jgi:signal transduction histidine kinase
LLVLASGFVFSALLLVPHTLSFPGAFTREGLLGAGPSSTAWIAATRRIAFPIFVALYALLIPDPLSKMVAQKQGSFVVAFASAVALAVGITLVALLGDRWLPPFFVNHVDVVPGTLFVTSIVSIAVTLVGIAMLLRKPLSVLNLWLLVALGGWLIQSILNLPLTARFTVGFYALFLLMLSAHLIVLVALIAESNRLYARLALATAARAREREAQRLSIDAVAAAISHEVGQPLAAVSLSTSAGLNWLTAPRPDVAKAIESLHSTNESVQRSFDVLKSIRAMLAKEPGWAEDVNINELVTDTVAMLDRELAGAKVSVQLELSAGLATVQGSRVQLQLVMSNLIANAVESVASSPGGRKRRVTISSTQQDGAVMLEVSDNGAGIAAEDAWSVFEAFQGAESDGRGIDLALCRTIVEEHGGQIQASRGKQHGTTFHVRLPSIPSKAG